MNDPEAKDCFDNFQFVIYTAISNMLQEQTACRVADPQSKVKQSIRILIK